MGRSPIWLEAGVQVNAARRRRRRGWPEPSPSEFGPPSRTTPSEKMLCVQLIFWLGVAASVSIGLGNAGNDLCNAMGVTVGARVLPLWKAVVLGALFDGLGALLMGGRVAHTVGERIVDPALYSDEPLLLAKAMLVVMLAGGDAEPEDELDAEHRIFRRGGDGGETEAATAGRPRRRRRGDRGEHT